MSATSAYPNENQGPTILVATFVVTIVAFITFATRLFVRIKMIRNLGWDVLIVPEVYFGAGKHRDQIDPADFQQAFKLNFITQPIYLFATMFVKQSVGLFLLRIAATPFYRRLIISVMAFMAIYTIGCFMTIVLQCTDLAVQWDPDVDGTCWGPATLQALGYTNVALNVATDFTFSVFIPIPMLWHVQMNRRQKSSIIGILALGIFASVAALIKTAALVDYGKTGDWLWDSRSLTIWTVVECNTGIVAGNLPCLKPLFRRVLGSTYGRGSRAQSNSKYGTGTIKKSVRNYSSLGSEHAKRNAFQPYGQGGMHMMTDIVVNKEMTVRQSDSRDEIDEAGKSSQESLVGETEVAAFPNMGGIKKTTQVDISEASAEEITRTTARRLKGT
ncbi:hypothetical protein K504DRAFT_380309 [Pleomassaria siparia CBS 279.74]|uniref:Rhodopsin domain-containing protein n=1 Tax=Pleomassaria siparia CBS 279.74 TaxID=1314801 RepID=A0A6G1K6W2_9PLEO|nr:hypothetical protein K504DRAFT_380309 [Pleomassaria siparia CBS 279.74]